MAQSSEIKLNKRFDQNIEITGTLTVGGNSVLTSYTETDPTVPSHVKSITTTNISNWDTAYDWGDHADAGYLTSVPADISITTGTFSGRVKADTLELTSGTAHLTFTESGLDWSIINNYAGYNNGIAIYNGTGGVDIIYGEATIAEFDTNGVTFHENVTVNGTISATGYNKTNWDTAYGWGNHASQNYADTTDVNEAIAQSLGWVPAYSNTNTSSIRWNETEQAVEIQSNSDTTTGAAYKAIRMKSGDKVRVTVMVRSTVTTTDGLYLRLYFHNGDMPDGKTHVSNSASSSTAWVQEDDSGDTGWWENNAVTTSWQNFERTYTAPADGYLSLVILNWSGIGTNPLYVKNPDIQFEKVSEATTADSITNQTLSNTLSVEGDLKALGQIRATGWWGSSSSSVNGQALEIGVSAPDSSEAYVLSYNRNTSSYGDMNFAAVNFNFDEKGGTTTIENNEIWHAGNDGSGSGLDADTVDGVHASSFLRNDTDATVTGYLRVTGASANTTGAILGTYTGGTSLAASEVVLGSGGKTGWSPGDEFGAIRWYNTDGSGVGARDAAKIIALNTQGNGTSTTTFNGELAFYTSAHNTASAEAMRIDDTGRVGIGTTAPNGRLELKGSGQSWGTAPIIRLWDSYNDKGWLVGSANNHQPGDFYIRTLPSETTSPSASQQEFTIKHSTGAVGIGTYNPAGGYLLHVTGLAKFNNAVAIDGVETGNPAAAADQIRVSGYGILGNRGTFYVTNPQNVQIGNGNSHNASPTANFSSGSIDFYRGTTVHANMAADSFITKVSGVGDVNLRMQRFSSAGRTQYTFEDENGGQLWRCGLTGPGSVDYAFYDGTRNAAIFKRNGDIVLTPGGKVGINTDSPSYNLDVAGSARIGGNFTGTEFRIEATDTAGAPAATATIKMVGYEGRAIGTFYNDVSYGGEWFSGLRYSGAFANYQIGYDASAGQSEYAAKSMMTITNGGRVGIGTSAPTAQLHVEGYTYLNPSTSAALVVGRVGGTPNIVAGSDDGGYLLMDSNGGMVGLNWYNNQTVVLANGGGNVGVGRSDPGYRLDVSGDIRATGTVRATTDIYVGDQIIHDGDTDTYLQFHAANQFRVVAAGAEVTEWGANYMKMGDNDTFRMGAGSDFRQWHNGTDHYFRNYHHAGGNIYFQTEGTGGVNHALIYMYGNTARPYVVLYEDSVERLRTVSDGVDVTGIMTATEDVVAYSDERVKENVKTIDNALDKVKALRGVSYNRTDLEDKSPKIGVIAQEVQKVLPEVVYEQSNEMLAVSYGNMVSVLIEAVKELSNKVEELENKLNGTEL